MTVECQPCVEAVNQNYTLGTGEMTVCLESDGIIRNLGNVSELTLTSTPETLEHFRGSDGALDAIIPLRKDFTLSATLDELTPTNFALFLGGTLVNTVNGCKIPLTGFTGTCSVSTAAMQFIHTMRCSGRTVTINIWRAFFGSEETSITFGEEIANLPLAIRALSCASLHPDEPFGNVEFEESCVTS